MLFAMPLPVLCGRTIYMSITKANPRATRCKKRSSRIEPPPLQRNRHCLTTEPPSSFYKWGSIAIYIASNDRGSFQSCEILPNWLSLTRPHSTQIWTRTDQSSMLCANCGPQSGPQSVAPATRAAESGCECCWSNAGEVCYSTVAAC